MRSREVAPAPFVSLVAHELQAPLAAIEGYPDIIQDGGGEDPERTRKVLDRCRERTSGLLALIQDLLAMSRMQNGQILPPFSSPGEVGTGKGRMAWVIFLWREGEICHSARLRGRNS